MNQERTTFLLNRCSEPITFLDVQVNPIVKDVGHINNKVFPKNGSKIGIFGYYKRLG
jgi:hypothetical protein